MKYYYLKEFNADVVALAKLINIHTKKNYDYIYAVPRGGIPLAIALSGILQIPMIENFPDSNDRILVVDDLVDSGKTRQKFMYNDFVCIHIKEHTPKELYPTIYLRTENDWIEYWWEKNETPIQDSIVRILQYINEDPNRQGLVDTPKRIVKSYDHLFSGYKKDVKSIITVFDNPKCDEIVLLKNIELYSMCEHHMLPFFGQAHIAYIPDKKVIGISKLARLLEIYSRRLQIQERIGEQITSDLMKYLEPKGAACIIDAVHMCMRMRGVEKQNSSMVTSSLKGVFLQDSDHGRAARKELMDLIKL